jgi:PAS domain S-box-containing protein
MNRYKAFFRDLPISLKLLVSYSSLFVLTMLLGGVIIYSFVRNAIETNIESELKNTTTTILSMVRTAANTSIKNYLRAAAEQNLEIIGTIHDKQMKGLMTEEQAKSFAREILLSQTIGKTGYLYTVDSHGKAPVHPKPGIEGRTFLHRKFVRDQIKLKEGYLEYNWRNPGEERERPKALYMTYFEPWDWIISVSSYREEFVKLVNVSDFRDSILALRFGKTGYSFVLDSKGNPIVHPVLKGNSFDVTDAQGNYFVRKICEMKRGKLVYSWKNPGERDFRDKLVIFNYIPEYDWIVASSCYLEESYAPLNKVRNIVFVTVMGTLLLVLPTTLLISGSILKPLLSLMERFAAGKAGDLTVRMETVSKDEVGQLSKYFNDFMERLEGYRDKLVSEVKDRKKSEEALRLSEEMFSKAFQGNPSGMIIASLDEGRLINVNDSFLQFTGYELREVKSKSLLDPDFLLDNATASALLTAVRDNSHLKSQDLRFTTSSGEARLGVISAELVELWGEKCMLAALEDVTDSRRLEREILEISEREHQKIGRDLHDDLCPHLIGVEFLSKVLTRKLVDKDLSEAADASRIRALIQDSIKKLRRLSRGLCPVDLEEDGFDASLASLGLYVEDVFGVAFHFRCDSPIAIHDQTKATHLYYIAHEAVHNAVKHSGARNIFVTLESDNGTLELIIRDDGQGIEDDAHSNGMGLRIMNYRARRIGAAIEVKRDATCGTQVRLRVEAG